MRFIMPLVWALLISAMISYVLSSMAGAAFDLTSSVVLAIILAIGTILLGEGVLKGENEQ